MYDELVESLRDKAEFLDKTSYERNVHNSFAETMKQAADAIEALSMRLLGDEAAIAGMKREIERMVVTGKPNWIPVTERLPGYGDRCLAVIRRDDGKQRVGISYCFVQREGFWSDKGADWEVTHWMPLPEPPKEGTK